jgi:hypothetical protein
MGKRVLSFLLPENVYEKVMQTARTVLIDYPKSIQEYILYAFRMIPNIIKIPFTRKVEHSNELATPIAPFVEYEGTHITSDEMLLENITDKGGTCELVLCCAFTGRHRIVEKIVEESFYSNEAQQVRWMLAGSTQEDEAFIRALSRKTRKVAGFIVENRPLGRKWQTCMYFATRYYQSELYGITGSDDIVSNKLVDYIIRRHRKNVELTKNPSFLPGMYGTLEWLVSHTNTQHTLVPQIIKCSYGYESAFEPLGAGRFYTRSFLEECKGLIFESNLERLLDDRGYFEVRNHGRPLEYYSIEDGPVISVKGDWAQLNSVSDFLAAKTLALEEYSFAGYALLSKSISDATQKYLFKPAMISPQLNFSQINTGID